MTARTDGAYDADSDPIDEPGYQLNAGVGHYAASDEPGYESGVCAGVYEGTVQGHSRGLVLGLSSGRREGREEGRSLGRSFAIGIGQGLAPPPDANAPTITYVSPTPGAAPGTAGGFPADPAAAKVFPIVIQILDLAPGTRYVCVVIRYMDAEDVEIEETVYRRDNFRGRFVTGSKAELVGDALQLTIMHNGGWLELIQGQSKQFGFYVDAVDTAGNVNEVE